MKTRHVLDTCRIVLMLCVVLCVCGVGWADLSAGDMYLDPSLIPSADYSYEYHPSAYTANFTDVQSLQVLPPLTSDGSAYYFTPTVDYTGDITGTDGSITFNRPGPYFVLATYTNAETELFDYGIEFLVNPEKKGPTYNWKKTDTPKPDVVVVDPPLKDTQPDFGPDTTEVNDKTTWAEVTAYLQTLTNKHVDLSGHVNKGQFYWNGKLVLDDSTQATKDWLNSMKGHIDYLTFMSCYTGAGTEGDTFLKTVADILGKSSGYTNAVGGNGTDWFINDEGTLKTVPEPISVFSGIVGLSMVVGYFRNRRRPKGEMRQAA